MKQKILTQRGDIFRIIVFFILGLTIYSNTFHASFHLDDWHNIVNNYAIRNLWNLKAVWGFFPSRFVTYLSLAVNYHFHQLSLSGYHVFNLAVHLGTAMLVSWFAFLILSTPAAKMHFVARHANLISLWAGLLFVSHPIQTQAVTYIIQRTASLATLFYLLSVCLYLKSRLAREENPKTAGWISPYVGSVLSALAALFTKETAVTLPFMLLLCEFSFFPKGQKNAIKRLWPFFFILIGLLATIKITGSVDFAEIRILKETRSDLTAITPVQYLLTQFRVLVTYLRLTLAPVNQNLDYDYPIAQTLWQLPILTSLIFILLILAAAVILFRKHRVLSFCIFWFFLVLAPESSIIPIRDVIFEHRLYLPMAGFSLFLPVFLYYLFGNKKLKLMSIVLLVIVACCSVMTYARNRVWRDEITLWSDVVKKSPNKARPYFYLAGAWGNKGNFDQAVIYYNQAIKFNPKDATAYFGRGLAYGKNGDYDRAIADFTKATEINPGYIEAYQNRAVAYRKKGENDLEAADSTKVMELLNRLSF